MILPYYSLACSLPIGQRKVFSICTILFSLRFTLLFCLSRTLRELGTHNFKHYCLLLATVGSIPEEKTGTEILHHHHHPGFGNYSLIFRANRSFFDKKESITLFVKSDKSDSLFCYFKRVNHPLSYFCKEQKER